MPTSPVSNPPSLDTGCIVFYCKDCEKLVSAVRIGKKYAYRCPFCNEKNVAFGTERSIKNYYHIKE